MSHVELRATYYGLKGWGRTFFVIRRGKLLYAAPKPTGCVLRRTPILAWALLETLERHPDLPDVAIAFNCRDKPTFWYPDGPQPQGSYERATTAVPNNGKPALAFSCALAAESRTASRLQTSGHHASTSTAPRLPADTTGHTFSDVPLPDYTFWGLPCMPICGPERVTSS